MHSYKAVINLDFFNHKNIMLSLLIKLDIEKINLLIKYKQIPNCNYLNFFAGNNVLAGKIEYTDFYDRCRFIGKFDKRQLTM